MDLGLDGRVVFVTGGSRGIGRASALAFAGEGARVAISYHQNRDAAEQVTHEIESVGSEGLALPLTLTDDQSIAEAVGAIVDRWGGLQVLVNNAVDYAYLMEIQMPEGGRMGARPFEDVEPAQWRQMLRGSLEGAYRAIQCAVPHMRAAGWGRIVNISSKLADHGESGAGPYVAAKGGLEALTRTLAWELSAYGILTNVVTPGMTLTELAESTLPDELRARLVSATPSGHLSSPEDVARVIVFVASGANGNVNGERIRVAGGI